MISVQQHIDILAKESDRASTDVRHFETMVEKFVGFGISIVAAGFAYGIAQKVDEVFFVLPVAMFGIYYVFLERMRTILWLGAYKRALEEKMNELAGATLVKWEYLIQEHRGRVDIIVVSTNVVYVLILVAVVIFSVLRIKSSAAYGMHATYGTFIFYGFSSLLAVLSGMLVCCVLFLKSAYPPAYNASQEAIDLQGQESRAEDEGPAACASLGAEDQNVTAVI
jgi:hypothetical protein